MTNQHIVSVTLLKKWTVDGVLQAVDLRSGNVVQNKGPKAYARSSDLVPGPKVEDLESRWGTIETRAGKALARVQDGSIFDNQEATRAIKELIALHVTRSYEMLTLWESKRTDLLKASELPTTILSPPFLAGHRSERLGTSPSSNNDLQEEGRHVLRLLDDRFHEAFAEFLLNQLEQTCAYFTGLSLGIGTPQADGEFVIGDSPAVTIQSDGLAVGLLSGVPIDSGGSVFLPVGPTSLASIEPKPGPYELNERAVRRLNLIQCRRAERHVFCRPGSHLVQWVLDEREKEHHVSTAGGLNRKAVAE